MPPLGWKTARPEPISSGKREQVEVGAELAVVAAGGLLQQLEVLLERVAGRPRGAVDPLQLRVLLGAAPVGGGRPHELERADQPGAGQVRAAAQVGPAGLAGLGVDVVVDGQLAAGADLHDLGRVQAVALDVDQFELVRLVGQLGLGLVEVREAAPAEPLARLDDLLHALLDLGEVVGLERLGDVEVVVEAVLDRRADAELGLREDVLHRLGEHVRGRVAQHVEPVRLVDRDRLDRGVRLRAPSRGRGACRRRSRTTTIAFGPCAGRPAAATASAAVVPAGTTTGSATAGVRGADTVTPLRRQRPRRE